eukprot:jgi/Mesvir1/13185/Mv06145-RA.1
MTRSSRLLKHAPLGDDVKHGWLFQRGRRPLMAWKKRFFVLRDGCLFSLKNVPSNKAPKKVITMGTECRVVDIGRDNISGKVLYLFNVVQDLADISKNLKLQFAASSPEEQAAWIHALRAIIPGADQSFSNLHVAIGGFQRGGDSVTTTPTLKLIAARSKLAPDEPVSASGSPIVSRVSTPSSGANSSSGVGTSAGAALQMAAAAAGASSSRPSDTSHDEEEDEGVGVVGDRGHMATLDEGVTFAGENSAPAASSPNMQGLRASSLDEASIARATLADVNNASNNNNAGGSGYSNLGAGSMVAPLPSLRHLRRSVTDTRGGMSARFAPGCKGSGDEGSGKGEDKGSLSPANRVPINSSITRRETMGMGVPVGLEGVHNTLDSDLAFARFSGVEAAARKKRVSMCEDKAGADADVATGEADNNKWRLYKVEGPMRYFEDCSVSRNQLIPCLKCSAIVRARSDAIFKLVMDLGLSRLEWDCTFAYGKVIEVVDGHTDIVHHMLKPLWMWPVDTCARDLCVTRYWRREVDGTYVVLYRSTQHPSCPPRPNYVRAELIGGGFIIRPVGSMSCNPGGGVPEPQSLVTYLVEMDGKGWLSHRLGQTRCLAETMLSRVAGMRLLYEQVPHLYVDCLTTQRPDETPIPEPEEPLSPRRALSLRLGLAQPERKAEEPPPAKAKVVRHAETSSVGGTSYQHWPCTLNASRGPNDLNCWAEPDSNMFCVRSDMYLTDKCKMPAGQAQFTLVGMDWFKSENRIDHLAERPGGVVQKFLAKQKHVAPANTPFTFIVNLQVPGACHFSMVMYWQGFITPGSLLEKFVHGDDRFRQTRFKLIPNVYKGAWVVKRSVGNKPLIVGSALRVNYHTTENYLEADVDIGSSTVANGVVRFVLGYVKVLIVDLAFLVQGNTEAELPERLLGVARICHLDPDAAQPPPE